MIWSVCAGNSATCFFHSSSVATSCNSDMMEDVGLTFVEKKKDDVELIVSVM